jgi:hypothetical protein
MSKTSRAEFEFRSGSSEEPPLKRARLTLPPGARTSSEGLIPLSVSEVPLEVRLAFQKLNKVVTLATSTVPTAALSAAGFGTALSAPAAPEKRPLRKAAVVASAALATTRKVSRPSTAPTCKVSSSSAAPISIYTYNGTEEDISLGAFVFGDDKVKGTVDETAVDETAMDETAVDETAVDETAVDETAVDYTSLFGFDISSGSMPAPVSDSIIAFGKSCREVLELFPAFSTEESSIPVSSNTFSAYHVFFSSEENSKIYSTMVDSYYLELRRLMYPETPRPELKFWTLDDMIAMAW